MSDLDERLQKLRGALTADLATAMLDEHRFTSEDVLAITGLTANQLHNWVSRGWVRLRDGNDIGRGRKRTFYGSDILALEMMLALLPFGMGQVAEQKSRFAQLSNRAMWMLRFGKLAAPIAIVPAPDGDWLYVPLDSEDDAPDTVHAFVILSIDSLIITAMERMSLRLAGEPLPSKLDAFPRKPTAEEVERQYLTDMKALDTDADGNEVRTGLTVDETAEYVRLQDDYLSDDRHLDRDQRARYRELSDRHESARMARCFGGEE